MKLKELLKGVEILSASSDADMEMDIKGIAYDSRKVEPGWLFVAIKGYETDGHLYIGQAMERGAAAVICERMADAPCIVVAASRPALAIVSVNWFGRPAEKLSFIGVTGTNGKTTVTYLIKHILETALGAKVGLIGTNRNMIGGDTVETEHTTPESFELQELFARMAREGCRYVVMEVSSHALYLHRVDCINFKIGIFTNLTQDHLDFHKSMEEYLKAKARLFDRCELGIINLDDPSAEYLIENAKCEVYTYSARKNEADLVAKNINYKADRVEFESLTLDGISRTELRIPGSFSVYNALAAEAAGIKAGIELSAVTEAIKSAGGVKGRAEVVPTGGDFTILIDYAHTPDALKNILSTIKDVADGRLVVLFGCGGDRDPLKRPMMGEIAVKLADKVIVTSDNPRTEEPESIIADILEGMRDTDTPFEVITDREKAIHHAIDTHMPGDIVVLAGKGHETYQIVGKEKRHMDEREIVAEYLAAKGLR